jgi:hypothetical protein
MAGLFLSLAAGTGVWIVKGPATAKATRIFERIESALDVADQGLDHGNASLTRAAERLDSAKEEQKQLTREPRMLNAGRRLLARTLQQRIAPEVSDANEQLHTVAEADVVVNSVLEDQSNFQFLSVSSLDIGQLTEINRRLSAVAPAAWELSRLLGVPGSEPDSDATGSDMSRTERTLKTMQGFIAEYHSQVTQVRQRTEELKVRTLPWITPASVIVSLVCLWIALSQVSLMAHAWSWWRHSD